MEYKCKEHNQDEWTCVKTIDGDILHVKNPTPSQTFTFNVPNKDSEIGFMCRDKDGALFYIKPNKI